LYFWCRRRISPLPSRLQVLDLVYTSFSFLPAVCENPPLLAERVLPVFLAPLSYIVVVLEDSSWVSLFFLSFAHRHVTFFLLACGACSLDFEGDNFIRKSLFSLTQDTLRSLTSLPRYLRTSCDRSISSSLLDSVSR